MATRNFKLVIEYDGTDYHGWQRQKSDRSLQGAIEEALAKMTGRDIALTGSGRTDAGVHALGQVANFHCETRIPPERIQNGLNSLLDDDIVIRSCEVVPDRFHARYDVIRKRYCYRVLNRPLPSAIHRRYSWHIRKPLAIDEMSAAASHLIGTHDFSTFEGVGSPRAHARRTVEQAAFEWDQNGLIRFEITADGFLRYMVRNIMGTLAEVGLGKRPAAEIKQLLTAQDRSLAGATAPPQGLFLVAVVY